MAASNLKTDVLGAWISTKVTVDSGRVQGREKHEWQIVLAVYFALTVAISILAKLNGADGLLDHFSNDEPSMNDWASTLYLTFAIVGIIALLSLLQWSLLPRISGWFGGSSNRADATLAYYYMFCAGIVLGVATIIADFVCSLIQLVASPVGSYLAVSWLIFLTVAGLHISARIIQPALFVDGYGRSMGISLVSLLAALIPLALIVLVIVGVTATYFPTFMDSNP